MAAPTTAVPVSPVPVTIPTPAPAPVTPVAKATPEPCGVETKAGGACRYSKTTCPWHQGKPKCSQQTAKGENCRMPAGDDGMCGIHRAKVATTRDSKCQAELKNGKGACANKAKTNGYCGRHQLVVPAVPATAPTATAAATTAATPTEAELLALVRKNPALVQALLNAQ